mmetsp:Transcript_9808/g.19286  ORF Transcript_9808/g.19286 Transcript_9808/m.19286 type:complete len:299 (-) Transcript_9808:935-1831(-)
MSTDRLVEELSFDTSVIEFPPFVDQNWMPFVSFDGLPLATYRIQAENPRALLFYFHGYNSCAVEFVHLGFEMSKLGFECFALDHRGHGNSGGLKGLFVDLEHLITDCLAYIHKVRETYGELPIFLAGSSMGGAITINLSERVQAVGIVLIVPAVGISIEPNCCLTMLLNCFVCCCPRKRLPTVGPRPVLTRNTKGLEAIKASPLCGFGVNRAVTISSLFAGIESTFAKAKFIKTPMVLIQGGNEFVTSEPKAKLFFSRAPATDKEYWFYPEMHHCVNLEPEFPEILERLKTWLVKRLN